jgi:hypothetical protein
MYKYRVFAEQRNRLTTVVGLCARNGPIIYREKAAWRLDYAAHFKNVRAFSRQILGR